MQDKLEILKIGKEALEKRSPATVERDDAGYFQKINLAVINFS